MEYAIITINLKKNGTVLGVFINIYCLANLAQSSILT